MGTPLSRFVALAALVVVAAREVHVRPRRRDRSRTERPAHCVFEASMIGISAIRVDPRNPLSRPERPSADAPPPPPPSR